MSSIKGSVLEARMEFIETQLGDGALARVMARLSQADRDALEHVLAGSWYPFALGSRLDEAIWRVAGRARGELFRALGRASADAHLSGVHRAFLRPSDPMGFLERAELLYPFYYERGRRTFEAVGPCEGVLTTYDAPAFSAADCQTNCGWHQRALELCGARNVVVEDEACRSRGDEACRYRLRWSPPEPH
jgi:uncharacterized protein (TIGR02265 family)